MMLLAVNYVYKCESIQPYCYDKSKEEQYYQGRLRASVNVYAKSIRQ